MVLSPTRGEIEVFLNLPQLVSIYLFVFHNQAYGQPRGPKERVRDALLLTPASLLLLWAHGEQFSLGIRS